MSRPGDDVDHLMTRILDLSGGPLVASDDPDPFVRYRRMSRAWHLALATGWTDERYVEAVGHLESAISRVDGTTFTRTPFIRADALSAALGFTPDGGVWVKDETRAVAGSHKGRHLMGIMLELAVAETIDPSLRDRPLAIASCGNAAVAAAVVARAAGRRLDVFVPPDAEPVAIERLSVLGARIEVVARASGELGDPTVRRLEESVAAGAIPFTCQGPQNGLAIEGGETLGYEIAEVVAAWDRPLDRLVVQVGGGALASACAQGLAEARALGVMSSNPRLDTVQTASAWPLRRAHERIARELRDLGIDPAAPVDLTERRVAGLLTGAARHRSAYMRPWETEPRSVAHGILDDETYDWLAVVRAMLATGGSALVVDEDELVAANEMAVALTGIDADETGTSGLAGLIQARHAGNVLADERVGVLFTGVRRAPRPAVPM
jgi:threonine dehydratase